MFKHDEFQMAVVKIGDAERKLSEMHVSALVGLIQRGANHVTQNEVAAKVVGKIENALGDKLDGLDKVARKNLFVTYREENADQIAKWTVEGVAEALKAIDEGKLGVAVARGPAVDPLTREMQIIARKQIVTTLQANNIKVPKGEQTVAVKQTDGSVINKTMAKMIEDRLANAKFRPEIEKAARKSLADQAKARERAKVENAADLDL